MGIISLVPACFQQTKDADASASSLLECDPMRHLGGVRIPLSHWHYHRKHQNERFDSVESSIVSISINCDTSLRITPIKTKEKTRPLSLPESQPVKDTTNNKTTL
jgi:hypothetical protein